MKYLRCLLVVGIVATLFLVDSIALAGEKIVITASADNMCEAVSWSANRSFGDGPTLGVGVWKDDGKDRRRRTLLKFDLPQDLEVNKIDRAELHLHKSAFGLQSTGFQVAVYRLLTDWVEGPGDMYNKVVDEPGMSSWLYNNYPGQWLVPGADAAGMDREGTPSSVLDITGDDVQVWKGLEDDIKAWLSGSAPNYGWILISMAEDELKYAHFYSKDGADADLDKAGVDYRPQLVIYLK
jgi:hypothetical protein